MNYKSQAENQLRSEHFDKYSLPDITGVSIPASDDKTRMSTFLKATGNPYLFQLNLGRMGILYRKGFAVCYRNPFDLPWLYDIMAMCNAAISYSLFFLEVSYGSQKQVR